MKNLSIKDLTKTEELDEKAMGAVHGGMRKLPFQRASIGDLLMTPDGEPVTVVVDGVVINSVTTGYAPK
jgi:hypothetical protein